MTRTAQNGGNGPVQPPAAPRFTPPSVVEQEIRSSHRLLLLVVRLLFLVLLVTVTLLTVAAQAEKPSQFDVTTLVGLFMGATAVGVIVLLVDARTPHKRLTSVVGVYLGVCVGLIGSLAIGALLDVVAEAWGIKRAQLKPGDVPTSMETYLGLAKVVIAIVLCYLAVSVVLTTKDDFRLVIPYVEFTKQVRGTRPLLIDSSVLIDGRIESMGQTGFISAPLVVPQFVLDELQALADSGDRMKRSRGRRGLHVLSQLQALPFLDVSIDNADVQGRSVDHKLLTLAANQKMRVLTNDYNLDKVAEIHGVAVLNLNELAKSMRPQVTPGETIRVELVKRGEAARQGVGYLPDGTMVVVEEAADHIGREVAVTVTNSLQTTAGRMIFGKISDGEVGHAEPPPAPPPAHQARAPATPKKP